jgi:hypothetical protein
MNYAELILFVVTDVHGHCRELKRALETAGYDRNDPCHLLVVLGDCFDRGRENREVLEFFEGIERKIMVRGNHEDLLEDVLDSHKIDLIHELNGTEDTILAFFGKGAIDPGTFRLYPDRFVADRLKAFLSPMINYFETEKHIFVHGWIPVFDKEGLVRNDWRLSGKRVWRRARVTEWQWAYQEGLTLKDKIVVCGHRTTQYGRRFDPDRRDDDYSPFFGEGLIALDACTIKSGVVNVAVIKDRVDEAALPWLMRL